MDNQKDRVDIQKDKKKKKKKLFPFFIAIALIAYFVLQGYLITRNKIETIKATEGFVNDSILAHGIICREETILSQDYQGPVFYNIKNGQRVSKGMLIGDVYQSDYEIEALNEIIDLEQEQENIKTAQSFMSSANTDVSIIRKQLNGNVIKMSQALSMENYQAIQDIKSSLTLTINKINVATQKAGNLNQTQDQIQGLISNIQSNISAPVNKIYSPSSGYFISKIDGYENIATVEFFKNASQLEGEELILKPIEHQDLQGQYGKIITDYKWNLCVYINNKDVQKLKKGQNIKLAIDYEQNQYSKAVIADIIPFEEKSLVIVESSTMDDRSASQRVSDCEILFSQYKGIKIPKSALHIVNDNLGVYVKFSKIVEFKKVKPIFEDENYMILPLTTDQDNQVELFDDVIVKGVNMYDGKHL